MGDCEGAGNESAQKKGSRMKIVDVKQNTPEWLAARLGVVTASEADALLTPEFKARTGEMPRTYLCTKLAERILGYTPDASSFAMDQGSLLESVAVPWLEFTQGIKVKRVGFCTTDDGKAGASPDGFVGDDCGLEVKCPQPVAALRYLLAGELPPQYRVQVHFSMWVTNRPKWLFLSYQKSLPPLLLTIHRDEAIQTAIKTAVERFLREYDAAYDNLQSMLQTGGRA